jgi:hypothetical protein
MGFNNEEILNDRDTRSGSENEKEPKAYQVDDSNNIKENKLERNLYGNSRGNMKPVREGEGMGGQNFQRNNNTPAGNDKNNPSRYAGTSNAYFNRTEPSEEHPEDTNFKAPYQDGAPDYDKAQPRFQIRSEAPKPEKVERGNGENDRPHKGEQYQEGTADNENEPNVPGPNEVPDQQKVGEKIEGADDEREHIET